MRVKWLRRALRNIDQVGQYIADDDPAATERTVRHIRRSVERLAEHPYLGRPGRIVGTRELIVPGTPYIVPYRVRGRTVEVLRVLHGAQRWPDTL
jgi:toxin ParE1/3/4